MDMSHKLKIYAEILRQMRDLPDPSHGEMEEEGEMEGVEDESEDEDKDESPKPVRAEIEKAMRKKG